MARVLFIKPKELKENGLINGSVDVDKYISFLYISQDIHIQHYLGTDLYARLKTGITDSDLTANEIILIDTYIAPALIHFALADYYPFAAYRITNGSFYKHTSENAETVDKTEVDYLVQKERDFAQYYAQRLVDYLCVNSSLYAEYTTNTDDDINPSKEIKLTGGWYL